MQEERRQKLRDDAARCAHERRKTAKHRVHTRIAMVVMMEGWRKGGDGGRGGGGGGCHGDLPHE